jgi:TP901 family phage tail tape measure protein
MAFLPGVGGTSIGQALIRIGVETSQMRAEMAEMNAKLRGEMAATGAVVEQQGKRWGKAFTAAKIGIAGLGVAFAIFTVDAIKSAAEFDKVMGKVYALTGQSAAAMAKLEKQVLALSTRVPQSANKLAEGLYYVVSAGFTASDALKVLEVAAMDATVGLTDTQTVADGLTSAMNAYSYSAKDAYKVSDILTAAVTAGKMEWSQLAKSIGTAAVQGSTAGVSLNEVASAIATMTRSGLTAQRASMGTATLMRSLMNPTAGATKQMAALGVKFDSNTLKSKGLMGTLQMLSKAAGGVAEVIVKNTKGQIDWDKSTAATAAANKGWAANLQKMTGNARGFLAALIMLSNKGSAFTEIHAASLKASEGVGLTVEAFEKMKEADPGFYWDVLKNKVQAAAIEFGKELMPQLAKVVQFLSEAVPKAFAIIGDLWNSTLQPGFAAMMDGIGALGAAFASIFNVGGTKTGSSALRTILMGFADVAAAVARDIGVVAGWMAVLFSNPIVQGLTRVLGIFLLLKATLGVIMSVAGGLSSKFAGLARTLSFGLIGGKGAAAASPVDASAAKLATAGKTAAAELVAGATQARGILAGGGVAGGVGTAASRAAAAGAGMASALPAAGAAAGRQMAVASAVAAKTMVGGARDPFLRSMKYAVQDAGTAIKYGLQDAGRGLKYAVQDAGRGLKYGLQDAASSVKSGLGRVVGGIGKAFWPIMVATIAAEFIKEPLGGLIASNPQWARAGAKIKDDLFGGIIDWFTLSLSGVDEAVGRAKEMFIGKTKFSTVSLARLGINNATFDRLEAPVGTIEHATASFDTLPDVTWNLAQKAGEGIADWYKRVRDGLPTAVQEEADRLVAQAAPPSNWMLQSASLVPGAAEALAAKSATASAAATATLADLLKKAAGSVVGDTMDGIRAEFTEGELLDYLKSKGWTTGQVKSMTTRQLDTLGEVARQNADGTLDFLNNWLVRKYTGQIQPKVMAEPEALTGFIGPKTPKGWDPALTQLAKNQRASMDEWNKNVSQATKDALADFLKEGVGQLEPTVVARLKAKFGKDWLAVLRGGTEGLKTVDRSVAAEMKKALGSGWRTFVGTLTAGTKIGEIPPDIATKMHKQFGDGWFKTLQGLTGLVADEKVIAEMRRVFGENWREVMRQAGVMVWEQGGGADTDLLKAGIAKRISDAIASLTAEDLNPAGVRSKTPVGGVTPRMYEGETITKTGKARTRYYAVVNPEVGDAASVAAQKKAINKQLAKEWVKANVDLLSSPDVATVKKGADKLNAALKTAIPDDKARSAFITRLKEIAKTVADGSKPGKTVFEAVGDAITDVSKKVGENFTLLAGVLTEKVNPALQAFLRIAGVVAANLKPGKPTPVPKGGERLASGGFGKPGKPTWVGEQGRELWLGGLTGGVLPHTVSEFVAGFMPNIGPMLAAATAGGGRGGNQSINVDRMSLYNARDEQDVVQRLAFLMPNGR